MLTLCRGTDHSELIDKNIPGQSQSELRGNFSHADITVGHQLMSCLCIFDQVVMSLKMVMISLIWYYEDDVTDDEDFHNDSNMFK